MRCLPFGPRLRMALVGKAPPQLELEITVINFRPLRVPWVLTTCTFPIPGILPLTLRKAQWLSATYNLTVNFTTKRNTSRKPI